MYCLGLAGTLFSMHNGDSEHNFISYHGSVLVLGAELQADLGYVPRLGEGDRDLPGRRFSHSAAG